MTRLVLAIRAVGVARVAGLCVVPIVLVLLAAAMRAARGPYHLGVNSDPDYAYLTNALNVVGLQSPDLYEHPGITVEVLGALTAARWVCREITALECRASVTAGR